MYPVKLTSKTLMLRELTLNDTEALHAVYGDPTATEHLSFEPRTVEQVKGIIESAIASAAEEPRTVYMLAVAEAASGELIGAARLALGEWDSAQIGFALRPIHWGKGLGLETVHLLERLGFDELAQHRIWGARSPVNNASARTMNSAGMVAEGTIRGHLLTRGAWRDSIVHSILAPEYNALIPDTADSPEM